ncbi:MAG: cytochrome c-type biogenesis protein CcmH [Kiloniellaceae bacterium]|nr:cytochrome c-type biogenesis protein CcmH [Kiloniellaceae bacterium]
MKALLLAAALLLAGALPGFAVEPDEMLDDPVLEQRARALSAEIRCVVCQNESIDSSNAEIARELRLLVRERLAAGDSDRQVFDYLVARYGDFVLLRPPMKPTTYLLWFGPFLMLLFGVVAVFVYFRRQRGGAAMPPALSAEEEERLARMLAEGATEERGPKKA